MQKKEIVLCIVGIILLISGAFLVSLMIHKAVDDNEEQNLDVVTEEKLEVDGEEVLFKTYRVDQAFFLNVPTTFTMLDEETLKQEYNYNERPELVFRTDDNLERIFISTTEEEMTDEGLEAYLNNRIAQLSTMEIVDSGVYSKNDKTFAKLVAIDNGEAAMYYNIRFFTIDNKLVSVEFNTASNNYAKWEEVIDEIMDSICFNEDDIKKTN